MADQSVPDISLAAPVDGDSVLGVQGGAVKRFPVQLVLLAPYVGPTAPAAPIPGREWVNTTNGKKYTWLDDGNSAQWVEAAGFYYADDPVAVAAAQQARTDAQSCVVQAATQAATAGAQAQTATASAAISLAARDVAMAASKMYGSVAAAQADVTLANGLYFTVLGVNPGEAAQVWRKVSAAASTDTGIRLPSTGLVPAILGVETGYAYALVDSTGRAALLVGLDGTLYPQKITLPAASVPRAALAADVSSALPGAGTGTMFQLLAPETGYAAAVLDQNNRAAWKIGIDGTLFPSKLSLPAAAVGVAALDQTVLSSLVGAGIGPMFQLLAPESGYVYAVTDSSMRVLFGIPSSGSVIEMTAARAVTAFNSQAQSNGSYVAIGYTDGAGKRQVRSVRRSDGKVFNLTNIGNNYDASLTADNLLLYTSDASGSPVRRWIGAEGSTGGLLTPRKAVYAWGDSTSQNTYETALAAALGVTVYMGGIASQTSGEIMARQGGKPALLTVTGNLIPANGAVTVTAWSEDFLASKNTPTDTRSMTGTLAGVPGTLTKSGSPSAYTFTRTTAGLATACPANTPFITDDGVAGRDAIGLLWAGTNDVIYGGSPAGLQTNVNLGVAYGTSYVRNQLVVGPLNRSNQVVGDTQYQMVLDMEASLSAAAAANGYAFFNLRLYLINNRVAVAADIGIALTSQDESDAVNGYIPTSFRADTTHLTAAANNYLGSIIFPSVFAGLGWLGA